MNPSIRASPFCSALLSTFPSHIFESTRSAARNAGPTRVAQGDWAGFDRPDWLDPASPAFGKLAAAYYAEQRADQHSGIIDSNAGVLANKRGRT